MAAPESYPRLRAAAIDQRTHNILYRQTQLERLAQCLISKPDEISSAIATDYGHSQAEIAVEINLAITALRRDYASLRPKHSLEEEYRIAAGKDAPTARRPAGIVYIEPCAHTRFYSVVVAMSAAIAAGNCVILLLDSGLPSSHLSSLLRQILPSALDRDTFAIASAPIKDQQLFDSVIHVSQNGLDGDDHWPRTNQVLSPSSARTVAVVDRTANLSLAAHELITARFSFGGQSPYAPDIVFVNEFAKRKFLQAVVSECVKLSNSDGRATPAAPSSGEGKPTTTTTTPTAASRLTDAIESLRQADPNCNLVVQGPGHAVVETTSRSPALLSQKHALPLLILHATRSLDDAIDLISRTSPAPNRHPRTRTSLAAYHFCNPASGKYLSRFTDADVSFVNRVPREMLVGPAFPMGFPVEEPGVRYPVDLFTRPRPTFIRPPPSSSAVLDEALSAGGDEQAAQKLLAGARVPLAVMERSKGGGVGFFEQGFLLNAGVIFTTAISLTGVVVYWLFKHGRPAW